MIIDKSKISIRPEKATEYETVNELIYAAFSEQHGKETGDFMKNHFIKERKKKTFIPDLSLVAVLEDNIIAGEIALHETDIVTENGRIIISLDTCLNRFKKYIKMKPVARIVIFP